MQEGKTNKKMLFSSAFGIGTLFFFLCVSATFYFSVNSELLQFEPKYCHPVTAMKLTYHPITEIMEEYNKLFDWLFTFHYNSFEQQAWKHKI